VSSGVESICVSAALIANLSQRVVLMLSTQAHRF
jgi:hypothetical protein